MLELTIYLLVPWALVLPWSIIFNYNLLIMVLWVLGWVATPGLGSDLTQKIATLAVWYTLSCLPIYMAGFLYGRQERKVGYVRAFFVGHLLLLGNYVTYVACWRAMYRLITGVHGWEKTRRTDERRTDERRAAAPATAGHAPAHPGTGVPVPAFAGPARHGADPDGLAREPAAVGVPAPHAAALRHTAVLEALTPGPDALDSLEATADLTGPAVSPGLTARVPRPRQPAWAESRAEPVPDWVDHDASTTNLPVLTDLPARRPRSRSGHGQSRRVAGSHRAARARPAQHSGR
jgi:hypothetical protein